MADKSVRVILTATAAGFIAEVRKAQAAANDLGADLGKASQTQQWKTAGTAIGVVGLALTAVAGLAVKAWADFDQQMSKVAATGQDAKDNIDGLRQVAIQAGIDTKYSATEAAAGIEALLKAGVSATDILGGGLNGALSLAASGNLNVADSAEVAATAMTQFGLKGTDVGHIADLLAAGAGKAQGEVSDLAGALKQGGLVASQAGLSLDETVGTLTAFASAGLIGSDAGTSFRSMLMRLMTPTKEAAGLMAQYGINTYDTNGKFVTMTDLAGQLQTKLGGLSEAQRNNALGLIFGQDAIRGANVLYKLGAQGIADWTSAVNVQGYADDVARTKMDNLQGSLKLLSSSVETLGIKAGEAAGGVLRSLVDQLNALVQIGIRNQDASQGILAMAVALGGFALVTAGVMKTVTAVAEFRAGLAVLALAAPAATAAVTGFGVAVKGVMANPAVWALVAAFTAARVAAQLLNSTIKLPGAAESKAALLDLSVGGRSVDKMFQDLAARVVDPRFNDGVSRTTDLTAGVNSLDSALKKIANKNMFDDFATTWSGLVGVKGPIELVTDQFVKLDTALTQMDVAQARQAFAQIADSAEGQRMGVEKLLALFPKYKADLEGTAIALKVTNLTNQEYVDWMGGKIPPAIQAASAAAKAGTVATDGLNSALTAQELAVQNAAQAQADLATQLRDSANAALAASGSAIGYRQSLADATASVKEHGRTLDITTEAGRANQSALDGVASAALASTEANAKAGAGNDALTAQMATARAAFITTATQMGMNASQANALADKYGLIPGTVLTNVTANTTQAWSQLEALQQKMAVLSTPVQEVIQSVYDHQGYDAAMAAYRAALALKPIIISYKNKVMVAGGGQVFGAGTGTSDSIDARLSNKEYVVNAADTERNLGLLNAINYGHLKVPGFAAGGQVSIAPASYSTRSVPVAMTPGSVDLSASTIHRLAAEMSRVQIALDGQVVSAAVDQRMGGLLR